MHIVFLHPDLGIGGAERLVVDASLALKSQGHTVHFVTTHHDPDHCFPETKDGSVGVTVVGDWLPRNVFGFFHAICAYFRMIYAAYFLVFSSNLNPDVVFCDQVSACIPVLKWGKSKILFYCHFPDQLLTQRKNFLKRIYRWPIDRWEEVTTGKADVVIVNSHFTASIFKSTFKSLAKMKIKVIYPTINFSTFDKQLEGDLSDLKLNNVSIVFLSLNRYERKKNLGLAVEALACLLEMLPPDQGSRIHLILAGGYDKRIKENVEHYEELRNLAEQFKVANNCSFLKSPSDSMKQLLLHSSTAVLYTPENEHFGIVPLEAMYMAKPVIAVNSGGPLETVVHNETGILCDPSAKSFALAMKEFVNDRSLAKEMGRDGVIHVKKNFSFSAFTEQLIKVVDKLINDTNSSD